MKSIRVRGKVEKERLQTVLAKMKSRQPNFQYQKQISYQATTPKDVRLRLIDGSLYLINLREGSIGDSSRREIGFYVSKDQFPPFMEFLKSMGFRQFVKWDDSKYKFKIKDVSAELADTTGFGATLEFEKVCDDGVDETGILAELRELLKSFDVPEIAKDDYIRLVQEYSAAHAFDINYIAMQKA